MLTPKERQRLLLRIPNDASIAEWKQVAVSRLLDCDDALADHFTSSTSAIQAVLVNAILILRTRVVYILIAQPRHHSCTFAPP